MLSPHTAKVIGDIIKSITGEDEFTLKASVHNSKCTWLWTSLQGQYTFWLEVITGTFVAQTDALTITWIITETSHSIQSIVEIKPGHTLKTTIKEDAIDVEWEAGITWCFTNIRVEFSSCITLGYMNLLIPGASFIAPSVSRSMEVSDSLFLAIMGRPINRVCREKLTCELNFAPPNRNLASILATSETFKVNFLTYYTPTLGKSEYIHYAKIANLDEVKSIITAITGL